MDRPIPSIDDVRAAAERIAPHAHRTPIVTCESLDRMAGARLFLKCENLQKVGAFKFRGACNALLSMRKEEAVRGVATHSSGNHAAALSLAARIRGIAAHIVMPRGAPAVKRAAVEGYGGRIIECEPTQEAREHRLEELLAETGSSFVHPYEDPRVVAGQGTAALELVADVPDLDLVMTPVGGGGLLAGTAISVTATAPHVRVLGAEPERADDAARSFREGRRIPVVGPDTICDGLRTSLGELPFAVVRERVDDIVTVSEESVVRAMRLVWERTKLLIEPSSAVPVAAILDNRLSVGGKRVGVVISGGNVDLEALPWIARKAG